MRIIILFIFLLVVPTLASSATLNVPAQYPTIQAAINFAVNGDTVLVDNGTYVENIDFLGKAITVTSVNGANAAVIDGGNPVYPDWGSVVTFINGEGPDSVLDGFTITNGTGAKIYLDYRYGGGIFCRYLSNPTVQNNIIDGNSASYGGGIWCRDTAMTIRNNTISGNTVDEEGAGMLAANADPILEGNLVTGNTAERYGGGLEFYDGCSPLIVGNTVTNNQVNNYGGGGIIMVLDCSGTIENNLISGNTSGGSSWSGGGILVDNNSDTLIRNNRILSNTTNKGGGIHCVDSSPMILHNLISANTADNGGGICCSSGASPDIIGNVIIGNTSNSKGGGIICSGNSSANISSNILSENTASTIGGGIYVNLSSPTLENNTVFKNSASTAGGGLYCFGSGSAPVIKNSIFWNDTGPSGPAAWLGSGVVLTISHSDVEGGKSSVFVSFGATLNWGTGMIDADPLFVDATGGDLHLRYPSPCRETGDNAGIAPDATDFEGDPRIAYGASATVDMGADENHYHLYYTGDATPGGSIELKLIGPPGASPVGLILGFDVYDPPLKSMWGDWYIQYPWIGPLNLGSLPAPNGVLVVPGTIPSAPPGPYSVYLQAIIGTQLSNVCVLEIQ